MNIPLPTITEEQKALFKHAYRYLGQVGGVEEISVLSLQPFGYCGPDGGVFPVLIGWDRDYDKRILAVATAIASYQFMTNESNPLLAIHEREAGMVLAFRKSVPTELSEDNELNVGGDYFIVREAVVLN